LGSSRMRTHAAASRPGDNAAFGVQPQGFGVANQWAAGPDAADNSADLALAPEDAGTVAVSWPVHRDYPATATDRP